MSGTGEFNEKNQAATAAAATGSSSSSHGSENTEQTRAQEATKSGELKEKNSNTDPTATETEDAVKGDPNGGLIHSALDKPDSKGRVELTEEAGWNHTAYVWPGWKKWWVLTVIFAVQMSMNFNTSVWPNAITGVTEIFGVSEQKARVTQMIFLVLYAIGSELWAPFSEEFGRKPILQLSLFLVNIWQILGVFAPNFGALVVARGLGGLCTAGGSVTLGMVADLYDVDAQQYAVAYVVLSSVGGTSVGPVIGGFLEQYAPYRWFFWVQLAFGGGVQLVHLFTVPETRATLLLDKEAKRRRKAGETHLYGPSEMKDNRFSLKEFGVYIVRPFEMFVREPIVLSMSLLSGFSDALIFTFLEAFQYVYAQWGFSDSEIGMAYIPICLGYLLAFLSFLPICHRQRKIRREQGSDALAPEARLWWLLYTAPLEPIGLFGFAWTSFGPTVLKGTNTWIAPMIFSTMIAIANYCIYMATIDYMIAAYGVYSASATGGNALARDFLAGISAMYATPLYENLGPHTYEWASTLLAFLACLVVIPVYWLYKNGHWIRERSKFAQSLAEGRKKHHGHRDIENRHAEEPGQLETAPGPHEGDPAPLPEE